MIESEVCDHGGATSDCDPFALTNRKVLMVGFCVTYFAIHSLTACLLSTFTSSRSLSIFKMINNIRSLNTRQSASTAQQLLSAPRFEFLI